METKVNPYIRLYQIISARSDDATALEVVTVLEEMIKEIVRSEIKQLVSKNYLHEWQTDGRLNTIL